MGWCSGDGILTDVWMEVRSYLPDDIRVDVLARLIRLFEGMDLDCYDNILATPEGKEALTKVHPNWETE